jgi:hypothetical protein
MVRIPRFLSVNGKPFILPVLIVFGWNYAGIQLLAATIPPQVCQVYLPGSLHGRINELCNRKLPKSDYSPSPIQTWTGRKKIFLISIFPKSTQPEGNFRDFLKQNYQVLAIVSR